MVDYNEIDFDDLVDALGAKTREDVKTFDDLVTLEESLDRHIYLGDITRGVGTNIDSYIRFWNRYDDKHMIPANERKPIKIYINSCGGSLTETFTIINAIKMSTTPVWTIAAGAAYSGGFFVFIAGHKRLAYKYASFLYHEGSTATEGTANQFANYAAFYKKQLKQLEEHTLSCTNISKELYQEKRRDDWWMDTEEALTYGVCDEIISRFPEAKTIYRCDKNHCCNECPGHFDSANEPACRQSDDVYVVGEKE